MKKTIFATLFALIVTSNVAFALPVMSLEDDQNFNKNQAPGQLYEITITEDATTPYIKTGTVKITIPEGLEMIFDDERTLANISLYGTSVDNGKVEDDTADIAFTNGDKTINIPVLEDFAASETLVISGLFVEGFHSSPSTSDKLRLQLDDGVEVSDINDVNIKTSNLQDTHVPEVPGSISIEQSGETVVITWLDPTDLDLQSIEILRGKSPAPIDGVPYAEVEDGLETFTDTDVKIGDTVTYLLRASDGRNVSAHSEEMSITLVEMPEEVVAEDPEQVEPTEGEVVEDPTDEEASTEEPAIPEEEPSALFSDISGHWAESIILGMASQNIIYGNPDGTFNPNGKLNRAEAAALIYRILSPGGDPATPAEKPFSDVELSDWFTGYVSEISTLGLVKGYQDQSGNTTYQPGKNVTRAEFLKMAMNLYYYNGNTELKAQVDALRNGPTASEYADVESSAWYAKDVTAATKLSFVGGVKCGEETCFNPDADITRAEATKILYQIFF